ncbi:helix-turn-helix domain-containing protein [Desulfocucumis palustris]|uniref:helix-turn-helix domain-containing protein n=1 Tax=Desulfocucumis palustris TaxID=1898651 RepID=UPI000DDA5502
MQSKVLPNNQKFLGIKEISEILNVPYRTVYRWVTSGTLPAYKFGSTYRISETDFNSFFITSKIKEPSKD